jgi:glycosyltransferase involved in cell wall biosynthesis
VGDGAVQTGFARMNHAYADGLLRAGHEVHMLAINYFGDPHGFPYPIYPPYALGGGDGFGLRRLPGLIKQIRPDVVCVTNDPWNIAVYLDACKGTPMVASVAVDGKNCRGNEMNGCKKVIFWTEFGEREARLGGFLGASSVIPLGVDINVFHPVPRSEARQGLPSFMRDSAFILGVVGRNQPRKRIDLAMMYFAEWVKSKDVKNAYLYLHVAPTGDSGFDIKQLGEYLGISARMIVGEPRTGCGPSDAAMRNVYSSFDGMFSTAYEGWGLCHMEAMACGIPQILPAWSATGEWPREASLQISCPTVSCTPNNINAVGGIPDKEEMIAAFDRLYREQDLRTELRRKGLSLIGEPRFRWEKIGARFAEEVSSVLQPIKVEDAVEA